MRHDNLAGIGYLSLMVNANTKVRIILPLAIAAPTKAARKLAEQEAIAEVSRAVQRWYYEA
jgi:hypothetical protein